MAAKYQRGNLGAGLSTLFGMADGDMFHVQPYFWQSRSENALKERFGRETSGELSFRFMRVGGYVTVRGDIPGNKAPEPSAWVGQKTNLIIQTSSSKTTTFSCVVKSFDVDAVQPDSELWAFTATCVITAKPTYSGWATPTTAASVTKSDVTMYAGDIVIDPATVVLAGEATVIIDFWTLSADTDAAVVTRLTDAMTTATAPNGLKKRPSSINQDAPDGGVITLRFGLNDTNDDVLNPQTVRTLDPNAIASSEKTTALNATPANPTITTLVSRGNTFIKHTDGATQQVTDWGVRSTIQDITFPGTPTSIDKVAGTGGGGTGSTIALQSFKASTQVTGNTTEPTWNPGGSPSLKKRSWSFTQHTDAGKYVHRLEAGLTTIQEDEENRNSVNNTDVSGIGTYEVHARVLATATTADPDATAATTLGLSLISTETRELHDAAFMRVFKYGPLTNEERIEHSGSHASANNVTPQPSGTVGLLNIETIFDTISATITPQGYATSQQSTYFNTTGYDNLAVTKLDKTHAQTRIIRINDDLTIWTSGQTVRRETSATLAGGGTAAAAKIEDIITINPTVSTSLALVDLMLGEHEQWVAYETIIVRRRKTGVTTFASIDQFATPGIVNSDTFLGYTAGKVMYMGARQRTSYQAVIESAGSGHTQMYDLIFQYRSVGYWTDSGIPLHRWFRAQVAANYVTGTVTTALGVGSTPPLSALKTGWSAGTVPSTTFAPFLTP